MRGAIIITVLAACLLLAAPVSAARAPSPWHPHPTGWGHPHRGGTTSPWLAHPYGVTSPWRSHPAAS